MPGLRGHRVFEDMVIPANSEELLDVTGVFVSCLEATADFRLGFDEESPQLFKQGYRAILPVENGTFQEFKQIRLVNDTGGDITITIATGFGDLEDRRFTLAGAVAISGVVNVDVGGGDTLTSTADVSLAATATTLIKALTASRREIIITNLATNSQIFRIADSNAGAARGIPLRPGETLTLDSAAAVHGYNPGGSAESVAVVEVVNS